RDEGALFGVAAPVSAPEASVVALLSTAASVWSSVVSLTKGPSQGAGFGRQHVAGSAGPVVRTGRGRVGLPPRGCRQPPMRRSPTPSRRALGTAGRRRSLH